MSQQSKFCGVFVDLNARELEVVAITALPSEYAEKLVEKANVIDGHG